MSRLTYLNNNIIDLSNINTHQMNHQYIKIDNTNKFNGITSDSYNIPNDIINNNQFQSEKNYVKSLFKKKENTHNPNHINNSNKHNININTSTIINPGTNNDNNIFQKFISINDIIGEKCELNLDILNLFFDHYDKSRISKKDMGLIKSYGVNTYQGIVRNYNEDRVSIIINMNKPYNFMKKWPKTSFFGIYDGHGGEGCSEFLRDNLHKFICENNFFPDNIQEAIKYGITKAEYEFLNNHALSPNKEEIIDRSGSCAIIILVVDTNIYVANVGDSRCLLSMDNGKKYIVVTKDHKPNSPDEIFRIKNNGGNIYQSQTILNNLSNNNLNGKILIGPYRVIPGRLSVCRTIGDAESKIKKFGGNANVIISTPDIFYYDLKKDNLDFFILGCDGIYDQMSNNEILDLAWMILNNKFEHKENGLYNYKENININDIHYKSGLIVDLILKSSLARKSFDNVTCLFIAFKDFGNEKPNGIDTNINNDISENNHELNLNGKINPAFSGITPQKNFFNGKINRINLDNINKTDKIYTIKDKSNIFNKKILYNYSGEQKKNKTNRNENRTDLLNNNDNKIKFNGIFNTDSKIKEMNLPPRNEDILFDNKDDNEIMTDINNVLEKNNFKKIRKKLQLVKENTNRDHTNIKFNHNNKEKNELIHKKIETNIMSYTKKNQSFNKINKFFNNKNKNIKHIKKNNNIDINTYNTYTTKKSSEPNSNGLNNNSSNNKNFHIFKQISRFSKLTQPFKIIEHKKNLNNNSKNINSENKGSFITNNISNPIHLNKIRDLSNDKNSSYLSFNNGIINFDNSNSINTQFKFYTNNIIDNSNNNIVSSYLNKNKPLKKPKKYLSLNNTQIIKYESSQPLPISNNLMINRYINNAFTTKIKRDLAAKLRKFSNSKLFPKTNVKKNNKINISNPNISIQNIQKSMCLYNYGDKNNKSRINNYKNNLEPKSYRSFTYNINKNKGEIKYNNNYLVTDLGKTKKQIFFNDNKKEIFY